MKKLERFLKENNILKSEFIVVATSGGPDSMYLLDSLHALGYKCICAHVNHNVRKVSDEEYKFVENYCIIHNIIFEGMKIEKYSHDNFHNEARSIRYDFFKKVVEKYNAKYLATAHHGDDLVETIFMKISRGSNLNGYKGFSSVEKIENYTLIRPLIEYTKDEIKTKCELNNIEYVTDLSNDSDKYTRNRFRHNILNFLKEENKDVHKKYYEFNQELSETIEYINYVAKEKLINQYKDNELNLKEFNKEASIIKKTILELILSEIYKNDINKINKTHIKSILNLIENTKPQLSIDLPNNIIVEKSYNKLLFIESKKELTEYNYILDSIITLPNGNTLEILNIDNNDTSNFTIRLNSNTIELPLHIRTRQIGDKIHVKNMENLKKVKEIFIENKLSNEERKLTPIVTDNKGQILWIPGIKKSNLDVKKSDNYDIIIKYNLKER